MQTFAFVFSKIIFKGCLSRILIARYFQLHGLIAVLAVKTQHCIFPSFGGEESAGQGKEDHYNNTDAGDKHDFVPYAKVVPKRP